MNAELDQKYMLSSVRNALNALNCFSVENPEWGIRDLARHLNLSHSTVQRLLITLASEGYVVQDPETKKYRLGIKLLSFGNVITKNLEIHRVSLPVLQDLVQRTGETAHIGVLEGTDLVYLHKVEPQRAIRVSTEIGAHAPCYCVAGGKAILAYQDERTIEKVIQAGLVQYTEKTITDPDELRQHLKEIVQKGYAVTNGEYFLMDEEIFSVAAPIFDYTGKVFASLSLVAIAQRIDERLMERYTKDVVQAAGEISRNLGY